MIHLAALSQRLTFQPEGQLHQSDKPFFKPKGKRQTKHRLKKKDRRQRKADNILDLEEKLAERQKIKNKFGFIPELSKWNQRSLEKIGTEIK